MSDLRTVSDVRAERDKRLLAIRTHYLANLLESEELTGFDKAVLESIEILRLRFTRPPKGCTAQI